MVDLYKAQRDMSASRRTAVNRGIIAVLDIGSFQISCLVLRLEPHGPLETDELITSAARHGFKVIGAGTTRSRGVRFGDIENMNETERGLRTVVQLAQKRADVRVDHVIVSFSGGAVNNHFLSGKTEVEDEAITTNDVARAIASCKMPQLGPSRHVLHAQPLSFTLDGRMGYVDPRGHAAQELEADVHMLEVDSTALHNISQCVKRCDLELAGVCSSAYVAGLATLSENEIDLGGVCIDVGGETSGMSIFYKKHMLWADTVRSGGDHITRDISSWLKVSLAAAERIKTKHGGCVATGRDDYEMIEVYDETAINQEQRHYVSRSDLIGVIRPRALDILDRVRMRLEEANFSSLASQQIVMTGGGSQLPGFEDLAREVLGPQIRFTGPIRVSGLPLLATGPGFSALVGASLFAAHPQDECWDFDDSGVSYAPYSIKRLTRWLRQAW